jgi:predicted dehydrogenase
MTVLPSLGIGLIGVGRHGSRYVQHLLHDMPDVSLVAISRKRIGENAGGFPLSSIPVYGDYRALIADPLVQAVIVVTPPTLCHDICLEAVRVGKPLLIEKPLAPTAHEAQAMVRAADQAGVLLMTAHTLRFDATIEKVKEVLPRLGVLRSATMTSHIEFTSSTMATREAFSRRGAVLEIGIHLLDAVRFLTGDEVHDVRCHMNPVPPTGPETKAAVQLTTVRGIDCHLDIARVAAGRIAQMEWIGTEGRVNADWSQHRLTKHGGVGIAEEWTVEPRPTILSALRAFVHAIRTNSCPPVTGKDGQKAVEIAEACYRSAELGGHLVVIESDN